MKRVSFKVAKAIKEAGYPQLNIKHRYTKDGTLIYCLNLKEVRKTEYDAPYIMEVWLWLWREKKIWLQVRHMGNGNWFKCWATEQDSSDPEEAIEKSIGYLVSNDLIK